MQDNKVPLTRSFQYTLLSAVLESDARLIPYVTELKPDHFSAPGVTSLWGHVVSYLEGSGQVPTWAILRERVYATVKDPDERRFYYRVLKKCRKKLREREVQYVYDHVRNFIGLQRLAVAFRDSLVFFERGDLQGVKNLLDPALSGDVPVHTYGVDYFSTVRERVKSRSKVPRTVVRTLITPLDSCLRNRGLRRGETGAFLAATGCHAKGQKILKYDGSLVAVEAVEVGDLLMGPDSKPRKVLKLIRGSAPLAKVIPVKGSLFTVTRNHVLTLVRSGPKGGRLLDVPLDEWASWNKSSKHVHKLVRASVCFPQTKKVLPVDPYFLGVLLGDGCLRSSPVGISTTDPVILSEIHRQADIWGLSVKVHGTKRRSCETYQIVGVPGVKNSLAVALKSLGLLGKLSGEKFIPQMYKPTTRSTRLALLAGLLDTDGYHHRSGGFDFVVKSRQLAEDVAFISRSLGLAAYVRRSERHFSQDGVGGLHWGVSISGDCSKIPTRVSYKKAKRRLQKKSVLRTGFNVEYLKGVRPYYGFTLSGDGRYLMDDFTITHNTGKTRALVHVAKAAAIQKLKVAYYTLQLPEEDIAEILDATFAGVLQIELPEHASTVIEHVERFGKQYGDNIIIKYFPRYHFASHQLETHLQQLRSRDYKPDVIIVDFMNYMIVKDKHGEGDRRYYELGSVTADFINLCSKYDMVGWTAFQAGRGASEDELIGVDRFAESYAAAMECTLVVSINRKPEEKQRERARLFLAKYTHGQDGLVIQIQTNFKKGSFFSRPRGI